MEYEQVEEIKDLMLGWSDESEDDINLGLELWVVVENALNLANDKYCREYRIRRRLQKKLEEFMSLKEVNALTYRRSDFPGIKEGAE